MTVLTIIAAIVLLILVIMAAVVIFVVRYLAYHPKSKRKPLHHEAMAHCSLKLTEFVRTNNDNQKIYAWFTKNVDSSIGDHVLLLQHGHRQNRHEMLKQAEILYKAGFSILITTIRAHDQSDGKFITFGLKEAEDIRCWHTFLTAEQRFLPKKIGFIGNSMGGVTLLRTHYLYKIGAVLVLQSVLADLDETIKKRASYVTRLPGLLFQIPISTLIKIWTRFNTRDVKPHLWATAITIPAFIMQGGSDTLVPTTSGETLYNALKTDAKFKKLWFEVKQKHVCFEHDHTQAFHDNLTTFLYKHFVNAKSTQS
ncbi:hypothetical protein COTS27_00862 [Spirochaetota bacterium]|nr:hypothetical protein COTS27_00862 [Spirochaetota bacterium]